MRNDVSVGSVVIHDKSKYSGEMFGASAVCDVCIYVNVVRYIVYWQAINVCESGILCTGRPSFR